MNKKQRAIVLIWIGIMALMGLCPPLLYHQFSGWEPRGYGFIFTIPSSFKIDFTRLLVQWIVVALVAVALFLVMDKKPKG